MITVPIWKNAGRLPLRHDRRNQPQYECRAIEHHMEAVGYQTQAVAPHTVRQFNKCKGLK